MCGSWNAHPPTPSVSHLPSPSLCCLPSRWRRSLIHDREDMERLSELGVLFLLFEMGLELSFDRLKALAKYAFGMGSLQVRAARGAQRGAGGGVCGECELRGAQRGVGGKGRRACAADQMCCVGG